MEETFMEETFTTAVDHLDTARAYAAALANKFPGHGFVVMAGTRYARIVKEGAYGGSAFAFVDRRTGALHKAAGWKAPASGARFDLSTPEGFDRAVERADLFGGYLYRR